MRVELFMKKVLYNIKDTIKQGDSALSDHLVIL